jgi:hypothetical protein
MLGLMLMGALTWPVVFPDGQTARVPRPDAGMEDIMVVPPPDVFFSPSGSAAAVRFYWSVGPKYEGSQLFLVQAGQRALKLETASIWPLLWTEDGESLIGAGANTVRVWNLAGSVRRATPALPARWQGDREIIRREIMGLTLGKSTLCVRTSFMLAKAGASAEVLQTVSRYALPTLQLLGRQMVPSSESAALTCP